MAEIIGLLIATSFIAACARGRGGSPWLWGSAAVGGYVLLAYGAVVVLGIRPQSAASLWVMVASWAWVGLVALGARFLLGSGRSQPGKMWVCPNCKMLNQPYAVICEACRKPWTDSK